MAIVPYKTATQGASGQTVVLFELKTNVNVAGTGLYSFSGQAKLELIAAYGLSNQKVLVVLTDLASSALVYELVFVVASQSFELIEYVVNLSQNGVDKVMFKRLRCQMKKIWPGKTSLPDFGSSLPPGSSERCRLVSQLMSSVHTETDYPPINHYSHMYA